MFSWNNVENKWKDLTEFAQTPESIEDYESLSKESLDKTLETIYSHGWTELSMTGCVLIEEKPVPGSDITAIRTSTILQNVDFEKVVKVIFTPTKEERKLIYKELIDQQIIQIISPTINVSKSQFDAGYSIVAHREFIVLKSVRLLIDNSLIISTISINRQDIPFTPEFVRGTINSHIHIMPLNDPPNSVKIVSINHVDPRGWIPYPVINAFKGRAGEWLNNIQNMCVLK
jgi:hypothetical protein